MKIGFSLGVEPFEDARSFLREAGVLGDATSENRLDPCLISLVLAIGERQNL